MQINTSRLFDPSFLQSSEIEGKKKDNIFNKEIKFSLTKNKDSFKCRFYSEIAVLLGSGMDLKKSLEIIMSGLTKEREKNIVQTITSKLIKGKTLSSAMEESGSFSVYDNFSVRIGEECGSLSDVLNELSAYYNKRIAQQRQIKSALTYPILVLCTTIFSLVFMLNFIVPMFEDVFLRFNGELPPITRIVISLSESFSSLAIYAIVLLGLITGLHISYKEKVWYRRITSMVFMKIPIVGPIVQLTYKTRFCQTMKLLISSKVHLLEAVNLIRMMIGFYPFEKALEDIKKKLSRGVSLYIAMSENSVFDKKLVAMTRVAEEVNKLEIVYEQLYAQYSEELDTKIKTMNNLLEPILIIFVGSIVAFILISMYLPIFQIGTNIA